MIEYNKIGYMNHQFENLSNGDNDQDLVIMDIFNDINDNTCNKSEIKNKENEENEENKSIEEQRKKITVRGLSGLKNLGNTCYMNSVIQCLSQLVIFCSWLRRDQYLERLKNRIAEELANKKRKFLNLPDNHVVNISSEQIEQLCKDTVVYRLSELFKAMWKQNCSVSPQSFKSLISRICPTFRGATQNDSQELLNFILDRIHEETKADVTLEFCNIPQGVLDLINVRSKCLAILNDPNISLEKKKETYEYYHRYRKEHPQDTIILKSYTYWKKYVKNNHSIITDLFTGIFYSQIICTKCNSLSSSFESFTIISIPTKEQDETTLNECLKEFFKEELLTGNNQYFCEECKTKVDAKKKMFFWELPEILIIQLKRFKNEGRILSKTNSVVKFPLNDLDLKDYFSDIHKYEDCCYNLWAISEHRGSCHYGHYIAHCKNGLNNKWYEFDDDNIIYVPDEEIAKEIVTKNAYILIYVRKNK